MVNPQDRVKLNQIRQHDWLSKERKSTEEFNNNNNSRPGDDRYKGLLTMYPIDTRHSSHSYPNCSYGHLDPKYPVHTKPIPVPFNTNSRRHDFNSLSSSYSSLWSILCWKISTFPKQNIVIAIFTFLIFPTITYYDNCCK